MMMILLHHNRLSLRSFDPKLWQVLYVLLQTIVVLCACDRTRVRRVMRSRAVRWNWSTDLFHWFTNSRCPTWHRRRWKRCCVFISRTSSNCGTPRLRSTLSGTSGTTGIGAVYCGQFVVNCHWAVCTCCVSSELNWPWSTVHLSSLVMRWVMWMLVVPLNRDG